MGQDCAYHHVSDIQEILPDEDIFKMKQKVDILEKTIHNQASRFKNLEDDMNMLEFLVIEGGGWKPAEVKDK